jgi:hypothetical protein
MAQNDHNLSRARSVHEREMIDAGTKHRFMH